VAYLAWKLTDLAGQEVGEVDPAVGVPDPTMTEATKAPEGGAGEARLPEDGATQSLTAMARGGPAIRGDKRGGSSVGEAGFGDGAWRCEGRDRIR
jgi:hypothetical protein